MTVRRPMPSIWTPFTAPMKATVAGPMTQAAPSSDSSCSTVSQAGSDGIM